MRIVAFLFVLLAVLSCTGSTGSGGISPITGILVRSETLVSGRGCGTSGTQLYRYVALVSDKDTGSVLAGGSYACYADAAFTFGNLIPDGQKKYLVYIFAFNRGAYELQNAGTRAIDTPALDVSSLRRSKPTWTTTCEATPLPNVQVLAVCPPLQESEGTGSIVLATAGFPRHDGAQLRCLGDGGAGDYGKVRATLRGGRSFEADCPAELRVTGVAAPADVKLDVELFAPGAGTLAYRGQCAAQTSPGTDAPVVCAGFSTP